MQIRIASASDTYQVKTIWKYCFGYTDSFLAWNFERNYLPQNMLVGEENGKIFSSAYITPYSLMLNNTQVQAGYLCGLATAIDKRGQGYMRQTLEKSIDYMRQREQVLSFLVPFNYKVFEKYGWRTAYGYKQYNIRMNDIPAYSIKGSIDLVGLSEGTASMLSFVYEQFVSDKNGYTIRNIEQWKLILEDLIGNFGGYAALLCDNEGKPSGYVLYLLNGKTMSIYELAYTNRKSYESLMAYVKKHSSQADTVSIKAPANDLGFVDFCDNRTAVTLCPFAMARITDVKKALEIAAKDFLGGVSLQIIDRFFEGNNGVFSVLQGEVARVDTPPDVITDIGTLTQLFTGYLSISEAQRLNLLGGNAKQMEGLFKKKDNFINMLIL
ncbi:MAG: GNAT family N-acetyltransferase [Clostridia bacterium]|nr:GNAT family N-acetyltransferase [Clostridia bacterium]